MSNSKPRPADRYHHGDLRNALILAAVGLVREDGPDAIVLREVARRVGVTANAAYRHFDGLPDLVGAVRQYGLDALSASMTAELAQVEPSADAAADAIAALRAVGRGYIRFALAEPGLFTLTFSYAKEAPHTADTKPGPPGSAWGLLQTTLDELVAAGVLAESDRMAAVTNAWATVHGLSVLLLGPMAGLPAPAQDTIIDETLDLILRGLVARQTHT